MAQFAYYIFMVSIPGMLLIDSVLLQLVWKHNYFWAQQRRLPKSLLYREGMGRWMLSLMMFDKNIQVTPLARVLAGVSGVLHHAALIAMLIMFSTMEIKKP